MEKEHEIHGPMLLSHSHTLITYSVVGLPSKSYEALKFGLPDKRVHIRMMNIVSATTLMKAINLWKIKPAISQTF